MQLRVSVAGWVMTWGMSLAFGAAAAESAKPLRWVKADDVRVRSGPGAEHKIAGTLLLGAELVLKSPAEDNGYCFVEGEGQSGHVACRFLSAERVQRQPAGAGGMNADAAGLALVRAFWLSPGWAALTTYANHLKEGLGDKGVTGPWPRDDALEKMKAHLASGVKGSRPEPYADWADLKRRASKDLDLSGEVRRLSGAGQKVSDDAHQRAAAMEAVAGQLQHHLGLWGPLHESISIEGQGAIRNIRLVRALEFPAVRPSFFRSEAEVAPPNALTEAVSGRFDITYRQLLSPRPQPQAGQGEGGTAGLYDMLDHTSVLVRSVHRVQLFRDGRLKAEPSRVRAKEVLRWDADGPMCEGWSPGFSFGDAHPSMRAYFDEGYRPVNVSRSGRLFAFFTTMALPRAAAKVSEARMLLNRDHTGFVHGTSLYYDLDGDGVQDLAVWEGEGFGPGHLGGPTTTNDRWYRLAMVNINGQWKVLGSDVFGYGCGC